MRYLSFLFLKMRYLRFFGLLGICLAIGLSASNAKAQGITFGVGIGAPGYYGPAPVCQYGYLYVKWNSFGRGLLASGLAIKACRAAPWPLPERRPATP